MRGPSNALGQVESSDAHDGHVTRLVSLRSAGLCKCLGSESGRVALGDWAPTRVKPRTSTGRYRYTAIAHKGQRAIGAARNGRTTGRTTHGI